MPYGLPLVVGNCDTCRITSPKGLVCLTPIVSVLYHVVTVPVPALCGWPVITCTILFSDVKLFVTCISHMPCFQEKGILFEKNLYI